MSFAIFLHKSLILEKSGSWDMSQNTFGQSDSRIFNSSVSLDQNYGIGWFFACWYKFMECKSWLKNNGVDVVKNGFGNSGFRTLKLGVSQEGSNLRNWFFAW